MTEQTAINLVLSVGEVNAVLTGLGEMPTSSGVYPIAMKIKAMAEKQLPKQEEPNAE